jgi:3-hydroxyisobutyrate dehydrogenase
LFALLSTRSKREEEKVARLAFLGTGIMGGPMARHLLEAGHEVRVWNRTRARAEVLGEAGAEVADSPTGAVAEAEFVVTMLADETAVQDAMVAGGGLAAMPEDALWIQMGTIGVRATEQLAALAAERGVAFVDAPVLGSKAQAEEGMLFVLASGPGSARERCEPIFDAVGRDAVWLGAAGAGSRLKLVLNHWILCTVENIAETFALAEVLDVDPRRFLEIVRGGAMDMPYLHIKGEAIMKREFPASFPLRLGRKDLGLITEAADERLELPLAEAAIRQFDRAIELDHGDEDMAATYYASTRS